jgi:hypothetical protein
MAGFPAWIVGTALYYDGLFSFLDWPALFNWMSLLAAGLAGGGLYLLLTPQRVGGNVIFHPGGFTVRLRLFFRRDRDLRLAWSEVAAIERLELGRHSSITLRRQDGSKVEIPTRFLNVTPEEAVKRLNASAQGAGYRLERASGFDLLVAERQVWTVLPAL